MKRFIEEKPNLDDLVHFGIKGMKWGVRKNPEPDNRRYSQFNRQADLRSFGKRGVRRINSRMNSGQTYKQAVRRELGRKALAGAAILGATAAVMVLDAHGPKIASMIRQRAETNRGRASALSIMTPLIAKKRRGAYKITEL